MATYRCLACGKVIRMKESMNRHLYAEHVEVVTIAPIEAKPIPHGEDKGYHAHRRQGVPFPEDEGGESCGCRAAHAKARRRKQQEWRTGFGFKMPGGRSDRR